MECGAASAAMPFFSDDDRSQIRREITLTILGVIVGALTTFVNKFIETEYLFQRNLQVIEYDDNCTAVSDKIVSCGLKVKARGLKEIKKIRMAVVTPADASATITTVDLAAAPNFAPPDPSPQFDTSSLDNGVVALLIPRLRDPQGLDWKITIIASKPLLPDAIQRTISSEDPGARIEEGGGWRWKRWVPIGIFALLLPLAITFILLIVLLIFRPGRERKQIVWE
jgi:hypothetical protein